MRKLLIVALLLALLIPMVIETSFAQEPDLTTSSNDRIFWSEVERYSEHVVSIPGSFNKTVVLHNKVYRGTLYRGSVTHLNEILEVIFSGYLTFTGIYKYSDITLY